MESTLKKVFDHCCKKSNVYIWVGFRISNCLGLLKKSLVVKETCYKLSPGCFYAYPKIYFSTVLLYYTVYISYYKLSLGCFYPSPNSVSLRPPKKAEINHQTRSSLDCSLLQQTEIFSCKL